MRLVAGYRLIDEIHNKIMMKELRVTDVATITVQQGMFMWKRWKISKFQKSLSNVFRQAK